MRIIAILLALTLSGTPLETATSENGALASKDERIASATSDNGASTSKEERRTPATSDNGASTGSATGPQKHSPKQKYTNPIIWSDYSDPDVECIDGEFWMTSSSFNCVPGLQILHSTNLIDWNIVGAAIPATSPYWDGAIATPDHGGAVWAPSIRYRRSNGRFYIFWGDPDRGIFQVNTDDPRGHWTDPLCVIPGKGLIDACPLFDEDGRVYIVHGWAGSRAGFNAALTVREIDSDCTHAISEPILVFDGNKDGNHTVEGPKFYKRDGKYWILAPAGSVKRGWQLAMCSDSVYGPYECRRVLEAADERDVDNGKAAATHGPHQGAWVTDAAGAEWFLHFEDRFAIGRVAHLQPVQWLGDGWFVIGNDVDNDGVGEPVSSWTMPASAPKQMHPGVDAASMSTAFTGTSLPLNWQWHSRPEEGWYMLSPSEGFVRLNARPHRAGWRNLWDTPNLLLEKVVGRKSELSAELTFSPTEAGDRGGVIVMGLDYCTLELYYDGAEVHLQKRVCTDADKGSAETIEELGTIPCTASPSERLYCTIHVRATFSDDSDGIWPPVLSCQLSYSLDGRKFKNAGSSFTAREGKWIGAKAGFFTTVEKMHNKNCVLEVR